VDVLRYTAFSDDPAGGNPAGVVLDATDRSAAEMLHVAAEVGYSETAFLVGGSGSDREVRYFSPWRPIEVSPIALKRFFSPRGAQVLLNEMFTVWAPLLVAAVLALMARRTMERRHNGAVAA